LPMNMCCGVMRRVEEVLVEGSQWCLFVCVGRDKLG